jgi:glycolate oxidase FAD binding subunit
MASPDSALAALIERLASARASRQPLEIRGGGSKRLYGEPPRGELLDMSGLSGISSYEPTELVVSARAGTSLAELEAVLEERGQCLAFEPPRFAAGGTVGGMVAAGLAGPSRAAVGCVRDHVLGLTLLNGNGEVLSFGGQVAKNVAGYDVSRLIVGSWGILGIVCEVSIKVLPIAPATATVSFDCRQDEALKKLNTWRAKPLPINASAWHRDRLCVRLSGARAAVAAACREFGGTQLSPEAAHAWWCSVRDQRHDFFSISQDALQRGECLWRVSVPGTSAALELPGEEFIEWQGAQRWLRSSAGATVVRAVAARFGGHATLVRAQDKSAGAFTPLNEALMRIHRNLKQSFDPEHILNPGRLYAGLQ